MNILIKRLLFLLLLFNFTDTTAQELYINEWMAKNSTIIDDEEGEYDDWIELYNAGTNPINLNGYYLTDDLEDPTKFQIEDDLVIAPSGYLLFWADDDTDQGDNHVNFKLSADGESIALFSPDEALIDSISFGVQSDDISEGRFPDGANTVFIFGTPTPNATNSPSGSTGFAEAPVFNISGGFYDNSLELSLSTSTTGASIYYTTDGTDPSSDDNLYTGAFTINASTIVRAVAVKAGLLNSKYTSHSYFIEEHYNLPVLSIMTDPENMWGASGIYSNPTEDGSDWERFCQMQYFKDENLEFTANSGIRIQGNSSVGLPKKSFRLFFESEYGQQWLEYPMFEDAEVNRFRKLVLRAGYDDDITTPDGTLLRDPVCNFSYEDAGGLISDGNWAVLTINGAYWGIYEIRESVNDEFIESHTSWNDFDMIRFKNDGPDLKSGSMDDWNAMTDFLMNNDFSQEATYQQATEIFDIDNLVNFLAHGHCVAYHSWSWGASAFKENTPTGKWQFTIWDLDRGASLLGWDPFGDYESTNPSKWANFIPNALMENEGFRNKVLNRTADLFNTIFKYEEIIQLLEQEKNKILLEMPNELARWNNALDMTDWETRLEDVEQFFDVRPNFTRNLIVDNFSLNATNQINLDVNGNGKIRINTIEAPSYPWSGIYFEGIPVQVTAVPDVGYVFAGWSDASLPNSPTIEIDFSDVYNLTANFVAGSGATDPIVINEINYHAPDNADAGDWIELYNPNNNPVDISAWYLKDEDGDVFRISESTILPANGFVIMAEDQLKFESIYTNISGVIGDYGLDDFKLANSGEKIYLLNANNIIIDSVAYDDKAPWPVEADGNGATLQLIDSSSDNNIAESWVAILATPNAVNCNRLEQNELPGNIINSISIQNVSCFGETDGAIDVSTSGTNLAYRWSNNFTSEDLEDVAGATYDLLVTSNDYCETLVNLEIATPPALGLDLQGSTSICHGASDGNINLTVNGGTGSYSYIWDNSATTANLNNLTAASYEVTVTDAMNCQATANFDITEADEISIQEILESISCFGENNGQIDLEVNGGVGGFSFLWNTGATNSTIDNLSADTYSVTVVDAAACVEMGSFEITEPSELMLSSQVNDNNCFGESLGSISVDISGGTTNYTYLWSNNMTSATISNLVANMYSLTVTDAANCEIVESFEVTAPDAIATTSNVEMVSCHGEATGSIELSASGGTGSYNYNWSNAATNSTINELVADNYTVTITDASNCQTIESFEITEANAIVIQASTNPILCHGEATGSVSLSVSGGVGDFSYLWNNNTTNEEINGLTAGTYSVTVTDAANCEQVSSFELTESAALLTESSIENIACHGDATGSISLNISGGVADYSYLWNTGLTTDNLINLPAGAYSITVTDAANCEQVSSFELTESTSLLTTSSLENITCHGDATGSISLNTSGGTAGYTYLWNTGLTSGNLTNLTAGNYMVTITDNSNCELIETYELTEPTPITVEASLENISCFEGADGGITLELEGGAGSYNYTWDNGATTATLTNLMASDYTVTIVDAANCEKVETYELDQAPVIEATADITHLKCFGDSNGSIAIDAMGGTGTLLYAWSNNETASSLENLSEGMYQLSITDENDCILTEDYEVLAPNELIVEVTLTQPTSQSSGTIALDISGGVLPYETYLDGDLVSNIMVLGLGEGTFNLEIVDANGCQYEEEVILEITTNTQDIENELAFEVFPNPSNGQFVFSFKKAKKQSFNLQLHSSLGEKLYEQRLSGKEFVLPLDFQALAKGIYFLSIKNENAIAIKKLIIQ